MKNRKLKLWGKNRKSLLSKAKQKSLRIDTKA